MHSLTGSRADTISLPCSAPMDDDLTPAERALREKLEYNEDDGTTEVVETQTLMAELAVANFGIPEQARVWLARLPNFLALETTKFNEFMWEEEKPDKENVESQDTEGTPKAVVPDENVIRWRWHKTESEEPVRTILLHLVRLHLNLEFQIKQGNSRIVRWSDGSLSLQVGQELFDIAPSIDPSAILISPPVAPLPSTHNLSSFGPVRSHGLIYLTAEHQYADCVEAQASIHGTLSFRPTALQSTTHRRLAESVAGRYVRGRGIKMADLPSEDPEKAKQEREKAELDKSKKAKREAQKVKRGRKQPRGQTRFSDGEDGEDDDGEDGEEEGYERGRSQPKRGRGGPLAQEDEEEDDEGFVVSDEDDDDGGSSKQRTAANSDAELDAMDEAEERIERDERRRKQKKKSGTVSEEEPVVQPRRKMVVESDDEDE